VKALGGHGQCGVWFGHHEQWESYANAIH
jgi:hypothetical protein